MKISRKVRLSHDKFFVKLLPVTVIDQDDSDKTLTTGDKLLSVDEYHRLLDENQVILHSIIDAELKDTYLYELSAPVEISEFYDAQGNVLYEAWEYNSAHHHPMYCYGKKFGEKYEL